MNWGAFIEKCLRLSCVVLGIVFVGIAIAMIYIGSSVDNALFRYAPFIPAPEFANTSRAVILTGVVLWLILACQIYGVVRQWSFILLVSSSLLGYLSLVGGFILYFIQYDKPRLNSHMRYGLLSSLKRFGEDYPSAGQYRMAWTFLQLSNHCCGVNNYSDWKDVGMPIHDPQVPISCCLSTKAFCSDNISFQNATQDAGCYLKVISDIQMDLLWKVVLVFEAVGTISAAMSSYLAWAWRNSREYASPSSSNASLLDDG